MATQGYSAWLLLPAAASLALFAWLLTLHPEASGRVYAAYGGVYISMALLWLWLADGVRPVASDWIGAGLCLAGMLVIMFGPRSLACAGRHRQGPRSARGPWRNAGRHSALMPPSLMTRALLAYSSCTCLTKASPAAVPGCR